MGCVRRQSPPCYRIYRWTITTVRSSVRIRPTVPVRIYLSVLDGEFGTAAALSTILLVASGAAVYAVYRVSGRDERAFV